MVFGWRATLRFVLPHQAGGLQGIDEARSMRQSASQRADGMAGGHHRPRAGGAVTGNRAGIVFGIASGIPSVFYSVLSATDN